MPPNQINFEKSHFNHFYNERFSDAEDKRDPDKNFFNKVDTQNFECTYLFPNEIESFLSQKKNSETINAIHVNIRSLPKNFNNLLDIFQLKLDVWIQPLKIIQIYVSQISILFHKKEKKKQAQ